MCVVALKFGKSEGEIWMERLTAGLIGGVMLLAHVVVFCLLVYKADRRLAAALAPFLCWFVWQSVSRTTTGGGYSFRFLTEDRSAREVYDITFTSCSLLNLAFFWYFALGW
jgi:hypothetical protein